MSLRGMAVSAMAGLFRRPFPACLMYHSIGSFAPSYCVDESRFLDHIAWLRERKRLLALPEFLARKEFAPDEAMLTFDDGYLDNYEIVGKVAERCRIPVTIFITVGLIGKRFFRGDIPMMDESQVRDISTWGMVTLGSHSMNHPKLDRIDRESQRAEISDSRKRLEDMIGKPVRSFCYPHGSYGPETVRMVEEAGYETAFTTKIGAMSSESPFEVRRIPVNRFSQDLLPEILTEGYLVYAGIRNALA